MAEIIASKKACTVNPLKSSTPLGAALAYLGVEGAVPLFHGSQGCTSFALVLAVRHFKEAIPLQTTAMNEAATVLGGAENLEEALLNVHKRMKPKIIGVASTALVETRGEDFAGELSLIRKRRRELDDVHVAFAATPDFEGALEEGWAKATTAIIHELVRENPETPDPSLVNLLPGVHQTPADVEELVALIESFGLSTVVLPDISKSLDGSVPDEYVATSLGGARLADIARMGAAAHTLAIGEHMRGPGEALAQRAGSGVSVLPSVTGLAHSDELIALLMKLSGRPAPQVLLRERSRLLDAMMDAHFWYSGRRVALAADPDLLLSLSELFTSLGSEIVAAIASTKAPASLKQVPCKEVRVGDLADLEEAADHAGAELLVTHSHGRMAAERLGIPLYRVGFPIFDQLGAQHRCSVGYRGTRALIYDLANLFIGRHREARPEDFASGLATGSEAEVSHVGA